MRLGLPVSLQAMGKALWAVISLLVVCILALGVSVYLTRGEKTYAVDNLLAEEITRRFSTAEEGDGRVVLAEVTDFEWDRVLVVAKGTPRPRIDAVLGADFNGYLNYDVESAELFLFERDGELARYADFRGRGSFAGLRRPIATLTPETAVFEVRDRVARPVAIR